MVAFKNEEVSYEIGQAWREGKTPALRFTPPSLQSLSETGRVSSVSACGGKVVVAAGQPEVWFSDHVEELRGGALVPLDGFGVQPGFTPELDDRCRLAYTWVDREADSDQFELRVLEAGGTAAKTVYRSQRGDGPLVNPDWGPGGKVAVVRQAAVPAVNQQGPTGRPPAVILVAPDGSHSEVAGEGNVVGLAWGKQWLAVMEDPEGTIFVDSTTRRRVARSASSIPPISGRSRRSAGSAGPCWTWTGFLPSSLAGHRPS